MTSTLEESGYPFWDNPESAMSTWVASLDARPTPVERRLEEALGVLEALVRFENVLNDPRRSSLADLARIIDSARRALGR